MPSSWITSTDLRVLMNWSRRTVRRRYVVLGRLAARRHKSPPRSAQGRRQYVLIEHEIPESAPKWSRRLPGRRGAFGHPLERAAIDLAAGVERHLVEHDDGFRRLVADALAGKAQQLLAARSRHPVPERDE